MKQHNFINDSDANGNERIIIARAKKRRFDIVAWILCLAIAFVFWIYFANMNDDSVTTEIKVALDVVGEDSLKFERGQMVYGLDTQEVTLVIKGTNRDIKKYSSSNYKVTVDVSQISSPGKHTLDLTAVIPGDSTAKLSVESMSPQNVIIYSDEIYTVNVPFEVVNVGINTPYMLGSITQSTDKVEVTGPRTIIESISRAQFRISELTHFYTSTTYTGFKLDFCDANGEYMPYDSTLITYSTSEIKVEVPIYTQRNVGVSVLLGGVEIDSEQYNVSVDYPQVSIIGDPILLLSDTMKDYRIPISLTAEELESSGVVMKTVKKEDLPSGILFDGKDSVTFIITVTAAEPIE